MSNTDEHHPTDRRLRRRDVFNDDDGILDRSLVMTATEVDEDVLALRDLNVSTTPA
jgi:hypothetical protein